MGPKLRCLCVSLKRDKSGGWREGVSFTAFLMGLPRDVGGTGYEGSGGFYLTSNHVGFTALDIDRHRIPEVVEENRVRICLWPMAPRILEDPPGSIEDLIFGPDNPALGL